MTRAIDYSRPMRSSALRWLVLLFTCAWFGVLVPIHQRGAIQLPGAVASHACCAGRVTETASGPSCHRKAAGQPDGPPAKPTGGGNCAVCYFVAALDLPAPVMLDVPPLGLAEALAAFDLPSPAELQHVRTRFERGPPLL